jgi:hypothetical protein
MKCVVYIFFLKNTTFRIKELNIKSEMDKADEFYYIKVNLQFNYH